MASYLDAIDTSTVGPRADVTPLFADPRTLVALAQDLSEPFRAAQVTRVACLDALGFILGTAVALQLRAGVLPIRKAGQLPVPADSEAFVDYSGQSKALELRRGALSSAARVLLVDDWSETGAQLTAAAALIERQGARVVGIAAIHVDAGPAVVSLAERYRIHTADGSADLLK